MSAESKILQDFLQGGPLSGVDVVDCHCHMGPSMYNLVPDSDADGVVRNLDALGISLTCVSHSVGMISDYRLGNDLQIEAVKKYPDRIYGYTFYNPCYEKEMDEEMTRCASAGLRGLKIHPDYHETPVDSPLYEPVFERAQSENRVLLCHYGYETEDGLSGSPLYKKMIEKFPKAVYILAHSLPNRGAVDLAVEFFGKYPNVYFDLANAFFEGVIEYARDQLGVERLLFGTDGVWSATEHRLGMICTVQLPDAELEMILGKNMRGILNQTA